MVLDELGRRRQTEGKSLGQLASEILAKAFAVDERADPSRRLAWKPRPMRPHIDLEDDEVVRAALGEL